MPFIKSTRKRRGKPWHTVEQSTAPPMTLYPPQPAPQPAAKPQRPRVEVPPGAEMKRDEFRPLRPGDLALPFIWAGVLGASVGIIAGMIFGWRYGIGSGVGMTALAFLKLAWPLVADYDPNVLAFVETITRHDLDGDGRIGQEPTINLNAVLQEGQTSRLARARMPMSQVKNWRAFCYAYTGGKCAFSGRAAESFHVDDVYASVLQDWTSQDNQLSLIEPDSIGPRLTPEPTTQGKAMIAIYGNTPLQDLGTMLQRYTGSDRQQTDREG